MEQIIVNIGSSSKKYTLYRHNEKVCSWSFEKIAEKYRLTCSGQEYKREDISYDVFEGAVHKVIEDCKAIGVVHIDGMAVRVVAPGEYFASHRLVDDEFMHKLALSEYLAPLHIRSTRNELQTIKKALPDIKLVAASDSAFHLGMPRYAKNYGISKKIADEFGFQRFGYHGHSVSSVWDRLKGEVGEERLGKTIVMHLGSGSSITALLQGKTIDTSMGFTPLEGLPMGTRCGTIDPSIIFALLSVGYKREEVESLCNKESGLLGISGASSDMREILRRSSEGDERAKEALEIFVYNVVKTVGSYIAALGGLDCLVFTAAIGEGAPVVRRLISERLAVFGVQLDEGVSETLRGESGEPLVAKISKEDSHPLLYMVQTNESASILAALNQC